MRWSVNAERRPGGGETSLWPGTAPGGLRLTWELLGVASSEEQEDGGAGFLLLTCVCSPGRMGPHPNRPLREPLLNK